MVNHTVKIHGHLHTFPGKFIVCPDCEGAGTELYGSLKGAAFSPEDFACNPDFAESYFSGHYDVPCSTCSGKRVITAPDIASCTYAQKRLLVTARQSARARDDARAEYLAERRFCHGY